VFQVGPEPGFAGMTVQKALYWAKEGPFIFI